MRFLRWLQSLYYKRCRRLDLEILWPICCDRAETLDKAKAAFALHAFNDDAWLILGEKEVYRLIDELERYK